MINDLTGWLAAAPRSGAITGEHRLLNDYTQSLLFIWDGNYLGDCHQATSPGRQWA